MGVRVLTGIATPMTALTVAPKVHAIRCWRLPVPSSSRQMRQVSLRASSRRRGRPAVAPAPCVQASLALAIHVRVLTGIATPMTALLAVASAKLLKANAANVSKGELKAEVSTSGCPSSMCPGQSGACHPCEGADGYCYPYDCADGCSESPCDSLLAAASTNVLKARGGA